MSEQLRIDHGITWSMPSMDNLRFMRAQYVQHTFKPHAHDYFVLGIIEAGLQSFTYERDHLITAPGSVIIINPGEVHTGEAAIAEGFTYRALYPTTQLMEMIAQEFSVKPIRIPGFSGGIAQDPQLFQRLQALHHLSEHPTTLLELEDGLTRFLMELIRRYATRNFNLNQYNYAHHAVAQVRDYVEAHYAENITLADLSALVHISPYHLTRLFHKHTGISTHKYLENVRVQHAEQMLSTGMPIADVAYATGFSSQSHLNRTFKRFMGTTPGEFVKQRKIV